MELTVVGQVTVSDCGEFYASLLGQSLVFKGLPNCYFDLYKSNGSTTPDDWAQIGETLLLYASGPALLFSDIDRFIHPCHQFVIFIHYFYHEG
jgi:hypothetical protein